MRESLHSGASITEAQSEVSLIASLPFWTTSARLYACSLAFTIVFIVELIKSSSETGQAVQTKVSIGAFFLLTLFSAPRSLGESVLTLTFASRSPQPSVSPMLGPPSEFLIAFGWFPSFEVDEILSRRN